MNGIDGISPAPIPKVGIEFMIGLMLLMLNTAARTTISRKRAIHTSQDRRPFFMEPKLA
ncbi:hypothetical protein Q3A80_03660 [Burkholderia sp. SR8]|uniref:hypothetical protein n=1 Tax=Burkholderia sp. SR8 TaxID=3062277 RepID=UPI0040635979